MNYSEMPITHCAKGRCTNLIKCNFPICDRFRELVSTGKNPTNCYYYNPSRDYEDVGEKKKKQDSQKTN